MIRTNRFLPPTLFFENVRAADFSLVTIQVLRHQRGGWMGLENGNFWWFTVLYIINGWMGLKQSKTWWLMWCVTLRLMRRQHLIYTTMTQSINVDVDPVILQLISTRGWEHNSLDEKLSKERVLSTLQHNLFIANPNKRNDAKRSEA